jgi:hypothetical protein
MSQDDVERVARAIQGELIAGRYVSAEYEGYHENADAALRAAARAALSAMPPRVSPELIAQLKKLATYLTAQGEYEAVDLINTVVERVSAMPPRELLAEALEALTPFAAQSRASGPTEERNIRRARAAADKIRDALTQEKQT